MPIVDNADFVCMCFLSVIFLVKSVGIVWFTQNQPNCVSDEQSKPKEALSAPGRGSAGSLF